ncbi:hypothetical protein [Promicromonospora panici]|uniref:hypothetical protein n=1 Tax=Promicromonospora panici TaxID=2219658 RepID=UPI00101D4680|nr:hypothetical protein [Promicromonospora panici]
MAVPFDVARLALWHLAPSDGVPGLLDGDLRVPAATDVVAAGMSSVDLPVCGELTVTGPTG